jgi:hypothetical protein
MILTVAMADLRDRQVPAELARVTGMRIVPCLVPTDGIRRA